MEKKQYVKPETSVCRMETQMMIAGSDSYPKKDATEAADPRLEVLFNEDVFTDIWGHEY